MARTKTTKENKTVNLLDLKDGVYFDERAFGRVTPMSKQTSIFGCDEYVFKGRIHKGRCDFVGGKDLEEIIPEHLDYDHGYTLEGLAQKIFEVDNSLNIYSPYEDRTFCYINSKSNLKFIGDPRRNYELYVRVYDNAHGYKNNRWVVIWAQLPIKK